ncbi:MAG: hypothetical protein ACK56N_08415, partial [Betaproteobacteria bacterium]
MRARRRYRAPRRDRETPSERSRIGEHRVKPDVVRTRADAVDLRDAERHAAGDWPVPEPRQRAVLEAASVSQAEALGI